jgi:hypothetical protein
MVSYDDATSFGAPPAPPLLLGYSLIHVCFNSRKGQVHPQRWARRFRDVGSWRRFERHPTQCNQFGDRYQSLVALQLFPCIPPFYIYISIVIVTGTVHVVAKRQSFRFASQLKLSSLHCFEVCSQLTSRTQTALKGHGYASLTMT